MRRRKCGMALKRGVTGSLQFLFGNIRNLLSGFYCFQLSRVFTVFRTDGFALMLTA
jgi:hypothetical protein